MPGQRLLGVEAVVDPRAARRSAAASALAAAPLGARQPARDPRAGGDVDVHPEQVVAGLGEDLRQPRRRLRARPARARLGAARALQEHEPLERVGVDAGLLGGALHERPPARRALGARHRAARRQRVEQRGVAGRRARFSNSSARSGSHAYGSANGSTSRSTSPGGVGTSGTPAGGSSLRVEEAATAAATSTTAAASSTRRGTSYQARRVELRALLRARGRRRSAPSTERASAASTGSPHPRGGGPLQRVQRRVARGDHRAQQRGGHQRRRPAARPHVLHELRRARGRPRGRRRRATGGREGRPRARRAAGRAPRGPSAAPSGRRAASARAGSTARRPPAPAAGGASPASHGSKPIDSAIAPHPQRLAGPLEPPGHEARAPRRAPSTRPQRSAIATCCS